MRRTLLLLLLGPALASPAPARALTPEQESYRLKGVEELFGLNFVQSRAQMRRLIASDSQSPFGYLFESGIIWWQASSESGLFKDTPTLQGLFEDDIDNAFELSKRLFDSPDKSQKADGYFVAGMALGCRGQWNLYRGHYIKAYRDGKKAIKYLKKCVKTDPEYYDAYLGLGMFDYQVARLGGLLKLGSLFIYHGDAQRGKSYIQLAAEKGRLVPRQAAAFLLSLLILDEKDYAAAAPLLHTLLQAYPSSPYYRFIEIVLLHQLGDWEASYRSAAALFALTSSDPEILQRKQLSMVCGLLGSKCFDEGVVRSALDWLDRALPLAEKEAAQAAELEKRKKPAKKSRPAPETPAPAGPPPGQWPVLLHLYRGVALDLLRQRPQALEEYQKVLAAPDPGRSSEQARHCLAVGCDKDEVLRVLKGMALSNEESQPLPGTPRPEPDANDPE